MNYLNKTLDNFEIFRSNSYTPYKGTSLSLNKEPYLDIILTDFCNRKCSFCVADLIDKKKVSDTSIFKEQIDYALSNFGVKEVLLVGGEPTLAKNLFDIISYLKTKKEIKKICITTNGERLKSFNYTDSLMSSGITHMNLSLMSLDEDKQKLIGNSNVSLSMGELERIRKISLAHNVDLRINNNIFKDNNDTKEDMFGFYMNLRDFCDSLKFSPLLKVDNFSVVNSPKEWVNSNILSPEDYENLYKSFENVFKDYPIVRNPLTFGFVEYSMIMLDTPIILNYNHRGMMAQKASMGLVNNIKLLSNGNLSLSWNKDDDTKVIRFFDGKETV